MNGVIRECILNGRSKQLRENHPRVIMAMNKLASTLKDSSQLNEVARMLVVGGTRK